LSATINQDSDMDAFQFSAQSGERVRFTAVTTAGTMKPRLFLYPSGGAAAVVNSGALNYLDYQLTDSGAYTLVIEDFNARLNQSGTGGYNLSFLKIPGTVNSAADPDSGPIASGQTLSANIHAPADMDAFQFFGQAGERVRFNGVKTSGSVQPRLFLYPPGGAAAEINSGALNYLDYQLKNTGLYTLVIMDFSALVNQVNTGNYNVTFLKMPGAVNTAGDRDGGLVTAGQTPSGAVDTLSDLDAFQFYGQAGDEVLVTAEKTSGTLAPRLFLCPPGGGPAEADSGVLPSINHQLQTSGLYTIVLQDFSRTNTGSYKLSYSKTPATSGQGIYNPSPANGAAINSVSGILGWDSVPGATAYDLYLGEGVTQALPKIGNNLASPSLAFANLTRGKTYYWQVVAHSAQGEIMGPCNWFIVKNQPTGSSGHILLLLME
jgi:hypothetical protein